MSTAVKPRPAAAAPNSEQPKRLSLKDAIKGGSNLPSRLVLHGPGGVGKTSFGAYAPSPFFLLSPGETGLHTLIDNGQLPEIPNIEVHEWENALSILDELRTTEHEFKTLVIDCIDGVEKLAKAFALRTQFGGDAGPKGFLNYSAGDRFVAATPWREFLMALDRLREQKQMAIICLAHTVKATYQNPSGPDYDRFVPDLYKDVWNTTYGWADIVLFAHYEVYAQLEKGKTKGKATGNERVMETVYDPTADAKNRHGLVDSIPMGESGSEAWSNFIEAIKAARAAKTQE